MCSAPKVETPASTPAAAAPAADVFGAAPSVSGNTTSTNAAAKRRGTSALRIDLNGSNTGSSGSGLNIPV